ncbi:hypothetical protein Lfu02_50970 [Longispora fulva]|nr:hypothetical protein Lfu02_50970 [Longispora fulva]
MSAGEAATTIDWVEESAMRAKTTWLRAEALRAAWFFAAGEPRHPTARRRDAARRVDFPRGGPGGRAARRRHRAGGPDRFEKYQLRDGPVHTSVLAGKFAVIPRVWGCSGG